MANYDAEFLWYDLITTEPDAAKAFYCEVTGWGTELWEGGDQPYTMWSAAGTAIGGLRTIPDHGDEPTPPPHWMAYVGTSDIESSAARVRELGGQIHVPPTPIPQVGTFAMFSDPQGAMMALFTPGGEPPSFGVKEPGRMTWAELMAADVDQAWSFYEALFGWNKTGSMEMGEAGSYQMYGKGEQTFGGLMKLMPGMAPMPYWSYYTTVEDLDAALQRVTASGGKVLNGPTEVPGGDRIAQCMDPQGAAFALHAASRS